MRNRYRIISIPGDGRFRCTPTAPVIILRIIHELPARTTARTDRRYLCTIIVQLAMPENGNPIAIPAADPEDATRRAEAFIPTPHGEFRMIAYAGSAEDYTPHLALVHPDMDPESEVIVRLHSECITGDLFGSKRCDCGEQLDRALRLAAAGKGVVIYLRQEGRGIGIINKLKAYQLQDQGFDTIEANLHLGLEVDARDYGVARGILQDLGINRIQLLTNNPLKVDSFGDGPIEVVRRLPLIVAPGDENRSYLLTKQVEMGHWLK